MRDRIQELRRVQASTLKPNPLNWRTHGPEQRAAMSGILAEIGYADALLARVLDDGSLELIDGHLRAETTPDELVPVLVLDVTEAEAATLLATLDPLAAMAGADRRLLTELLAKVDTENAAVQAMLADLDRQTPVPAPIGVPDDPELAELRECYQIVVECRNEAEQQSLFDQLRGDGYECRVLTL